MGTTILVASIIVWALSYFPRHDQAPSTQEMAQTTTASVADNSHELQMKQSYIGQLGQLIEPVIRPCGFAWREGVSILAGTAAKEIVASTMGVLYSQSDADAEQLDDEAADEARLSGILRKSGMTTLSALSFLVFVLQIPVFMRFFRSTGVSMSGFLQAFSASGYLVTGLCLILILLLIVFLLHRLNLFSHTKGALNGLMEGLLSVRHLKSPALFLVNTVGIWLSYYLHFYVTFYCFSFTENLGAVAALVAFVVGCFAVLVPTPNGAGPWHFAVKTVLVLYGVNAVSGALFALVVHTTQTLLIVVLGLYALLALAFTKRRNPIASSANE